MSAPERGPAARVAAIVRRTGWGFADQAFSSLTNFALGVLVARAVGADEFGAYGLAFSTYLLVAGVARSVTSDPLVVRFSASDEEERRMATADAVGAAFCIGLVGGIGCVVASFLVDGALSDALLALGITLPGLITQDTWRFAFFAGDRGASAFLNDLLWAAVLFPGAAILLALDHGSVFAFVALWGASATVGAVFGIFQTGTLPRPGQTWAWLRRHRDLGIPFLGQFGALIGGAQLSIYGIASIAGLAAAGSFRAVGILLGPVTMFYRGIRLSAVPDAVRTARSRPQVLPGKVGRISLTLAGITLAWGMALLLLPTDAGRFILGDTWEGARNILLPLTLSAACSGAISGLEIGLRAVANAKRGFRARVTMAPLMVAFALIGAGISGARGAAWGQVIGMATGMFVWGSHFRAALREPRSSPAPVAESLEGTEA